MRARERGAPAPAALPLGPVEQAVDEDRGRPEEGGDEEEPAVRLPGDVGQDVKVPERDVVTRDGAEGRRDARAGLDNSVERLARELRQEEEAQALRRADCRGEGAREMETGGGGAWRASARAMAADGC